MLMMTAPDSPDQPSTLDILLEDGPLIALIKSAGLLTQGVPHAQPSLEPQVKAESAVRVDGRLECHHRPVRRQRILDLGRHG